MEYFIVMMLIIAVCAFYIAHKADKKLKQQTHKTVTNEYKPYTTPYTTTYPTTKYTSYPDFKYIPVNIATKKARKQYKDFVVLDFETTGLSPTNDKIIEIGAVKLCDGTITDSFNTLVNPKRSIPQAATRVNGITDQMVKNAPYIENVLPELLRFIGDKVIVAHNASFDMKFLLVNAYDCGFEVNNPVIDTLSLCRRLYPDIANHKLGTVANHLCISMNEAHRSLCDVTATASILLKCIDLLNKRDLVEEQERKLAKEAARAAANRENSAS